MCKHISFYFLGRGSPNYLRGLSPQNVNVQKPSLYTTGRSSFIPIDVWVFEEVLVFGAVVPIHLLRAPVAAALSRHICSC